MKKLRRLSAAILAAAACNFACSLVAYAGTRYSVVYLKFPQEKSNWCWAACAQDTAVQAFGTSNLTQRSAVVYVKGSAVNEAGTVNETVTAASYLTYNTVTYNGTVNENGSPYPIEFLIAQMVNEKVPICGWAYYDSNNNKIGGHMITVSSVHLASAASRYITYHDPEDAMTYEVTYDRFISYQKNGIPYKWVSVVYR